jgi:isoquinoline 1-oxidoreductase beta subunit
MTKTIAKTMAKTGTASVGRRSFLTGSAGLTFGIAFGSGMTVTLFDASAQTAKRVFEPSAWLKIATDGTISIMVPASEMGQGVYTSLPMIIAEELDADWRKVRPVQSLNNAKAFGNPMFGGLQVTGASRTLRGYWMPLRIAGAQARAILIQNVAEKWKVPASELTTELSMVVHAKSGRKISYGEVAGFAKIPAEPPKIAETDLKNPEKWRILGKNIRRVDVPMKTNGTAKFGIDVAVPGMVHAAVLRAPVQKNGPDKVDDSAALKVKGVEKVIPLPFGVAVIANSTWAAKQGKEALKVTWKTGGPADAYNSDQVLKDFLAIARDPAQAGVVIGEHGKVDDALAGAVKKVSAEYGAEHVYHATMEPMNCLVSVKGQEVEIWAPTQSPSFATFAAAGVVGTSPDRVIVHTTFLGGGFGRRADQDWLVDGLILSKILQKPVKVTWSREDDVKNDKYRPLVAQRIEAGLDANGKIVAWQHRIVAESIFQRVDPKTVERAKGNDEPVTEGVDTFYGIPNQRNIYLRQERGIDVGFWRSVGPGYTTYAFETFMDQLAKTAGMDPVKFRLANLDDPRGKKVTEAAAKMAGWGQKRAAGRALGIAYAGYPHFWETHIAEVAEVSLDRKSGKVKVHKIWAAIDPGVVVQPNNVRSQVEGGIVHGVSHALLEKITIKKGEIQQSNFHDYELLRMDECPEVAIQIIANPKEKIGAMGEVSLPLAAPAIANAVFALTGKMVRTQPMSPDVVMATLQA